MCINLNIRVQIYIYSIPHLLLIQVSETYNIHNLQEKEKIHWPKYYELVQYWISDTVRLGHRIMGALGLKETSIQLVLNLGEHYFLT